MIESIQYIEIAKIEDNIGENIIEELEDNIETPVEVTRGVATSRSGLSAPREEAKIYYEEISIELTEEEMEIFERIVEAEVTTNNYEGKLAVANVILNRIESSKFPNTIAGVIYQPGAFQL